MAATISTPNTFAEVVPEKRIPPKDNAASSPQETSKPIPRPPYSALNLGRQRFILGIVTAAGFFGPLAGNIYLPALPVLQSTFNTSATVINATVSVFMGVLAVAVGGSYLRMFREK